jgi:hypothetical protein
MNRLLRLLPLLLAAPWTLGVVVDGTDPQRHLEAPQDDPGFRNVGRRGATSAIYIGRGWVLTARHSSLGEVVFDDRTHQPVNDSLVWLDDPSGGKADLVLFRLATDPGLPPLRLQRRTPAPGTPALLVGWGFGRGEPVAAGGKRGFRFGPGGVRRWGRNSVSRGHLDVRGPYGTLTRCFMLDFSPNGIDEGLAAVGDSGGAVFTRGPEGWRLAGVMISISRFPDQTDDTALFGNVTNAADLSIYAKQIRAVTRGSVPPP